MRAFARVVVSALLAGGLALTGPGDARAVANTRIGEADRFSPSSTTRQAIVVKATSWSTSYATVTTWERTSASAAWTKRASGAGRVGYNGTAVNRLQNSGKTPAGMFRMLRVLTPTTLTGVKLPQKVYDSNVWWPLDPKDKASYNTIQRRDSADKWRTAEAERLMDYRSQYDPAIVLDYNLPYTRSDGTRIYADTTKGGAIFLHNNGKGATAGCVSVPADRMAGIARWLDPAKNPVIIMGEDGWLKT